MWRTEPLCRPRTKGPPPTATGGIFVHAPMWREDEDYVRVRLTELFVEYEYWAYQNEVDTAVSVMREILRLASVLGALWGNPEPASVLRTLGVDKTHPNVQAGAESGGTEVPVTPLLSATLFSLTAGNEAACACKEIKRVLAEGVHRHLLHHVASLHACLLNLEAPAAQLRDQLQGAFSFLQDEADGREDQCVSPSSAEVWG